MELEHQGNPASFLAEPEKKNGYVTASSNSILHRSKRHLKISTNRKSNCKTYILGKRRKLRSNLQELWSRTFPRTLKCKHSIKYSFPEESLSQYFKYIHILTVVEGQFTLIGEREGQQSTNPSSHG